MTVSVTQPDSKKRTRILYLITEDWYFLSHRLPLARDRRDAGWDVIVATRTSLFGEEIEREGFMLVPIRMRRRGRMIFSELYAIFELIQIFRMHKPDIIHNVGLKPVIYGSIAALLSRRGPVVNMLAGMGYVFSAGHLSIRVVRTLIKMALKPCLSARSHWLIVQNKVDATVLTGSKLAPKSRTMLIKGSGVDTDRFKPMPEPDGPIIAAVVSRMLKDKGVREVVFAARELKRRNVQVEIWLVGDPDIENPTSLSRNELDQWAAEGCIRWLGHQSDIASIWAQAHIALLPSYHEGMPKALLEAAACGRPMIASDVPGCNELVVDGENGLLVPIRDWVQLADAIQLLAGSQKLRAKLGRAARETICADYGQQKILESTQMLYQRALAESA
jgi:glycosyltransferase involved in cell wall biosynthesis